MSAAGPLPAAPPDPLVLRWTRDLADGRRDYDLRGLAVHAGGLVVAATAVTGDAARLVVWRLDAEGRGGPPVEIAEVAPGKPFDALAQRPSGLAVRDDGTVLLLARARGVAWLVGVGLAGDVVVARQVGALEPARDPVGLVGFPDGGALLVGHEGSDGWAVRVDAAGTPRWEHREDRGRTERYTDAVALPDGGALLAGNSGEYDHRGRGPSEVFVTRVDAAGVRGASVHFPGRRPHLAPRADGVRVVYDRATTDAHEVALRALDARLVPAPERPVLTVRDDPLTGPGARAPFADFVLAGGPHGPCALAGSWRGGPHLVATDAACRAVAGTLHAAGTSMALAPALVAVDAGFVVAYPVLAPPAAGRQLTGLRLLGVALRRAPRRGG